MLLVKNITRQLQIGDMHVCVRERIVGKWKD